MVDQNENNLSSDVNMSGIGVSTTSPGGSFQGSEMREGFVNSPSIGTDNRIHTENSSNVQGSRSSMSDMKIGGKSFAEIGRGFVDATSTLGTRVVDVAGKFPQYGSDVIGRVDSSARVNPWMHIGIAGVGFFALGYLLGRGTGKTSVDAGLYASVDE